MIGVRTPNRLQSTTHMPRKVVLCLAFAMLAGCSRHENAPFERVTVGNGGNEVISAFRKRSAELFSLLATSHVAAIYAKENNLDLRLLQQLVEDSASAIGITAKTGPLYDETGSIAIARVIDKQSLELDYHEWRARLLGKRSDGSENDAVIIHEWLRLHPGLPVTLDGSYEHSRNLSQMIPTTRIQVLYGIAQDAAVQIGARSCNAKNVNVSWSLPERRLRIAFQFQDAIRLHGKEPYQEHSCELRFEGISGIGSLDDNYEFTLRTSEKADSRQTPNEIEVSIKPPRSSPLVFNTFSELLLSPHSSPFDSGLLEYPRRAFTLSRSKEASSDPALSISVVSSELSASSVLKPTELEVWWPEVQPNRRQGATANPD